MNARSLLIAFFATLTALLAIDALWLVVLMGPTYKAYLGDMMLAEPKWLPAGAFYLLFSAGLLVFAVMPALRKHDWRTAALLGAFLGLIGYGTYDLSNLATLRGWPWQLTLIDMGWGALLACLSAVAGYLAASR